MASAAATTGHIWPLALRAARAFSEIIKVGKGSAEPIPALCLRSQGLEMTAGLR